MAARATKISLTIAKALMDGKWHPTTYFVALAGYLIRPESAYRAFSPKRVTVSNDQRVAWGRNKLVRDFLRSWFNKGWVKRRSVAINKEAEWKLIDREWLDTYLKQSSLMASPMASEKTDAIKIHQSLNQLTDVLWEEVVQGIGRNDGKVAFKLALTKAINWSEVKPNSE